MERILKHPMTKALRRNWHLWAIAGVLVFLGSPFLRAGDQVFSSDLRGDGLVTPWIYDFTARELLNGKWPELLADFDYPFPVGWNPFARSLFATVPPMDAVVMAPVAWVLSWPAQWNYMLVLGMVINASGLMMLARAFGCRKIGLVIAAIMGAAAGPIWIEALEGRTNCFFPGLTLWALAVFMRVLPQGRGSSSKRLLWGALGAAIGWLSFVIYPPGVVIWIPVGLALVVQHLLARRWTGLKELGFPAVFMILAYVLSLPFLAEMEQSGWVMQEFAHGQCAPSGRVLNVAELFKRSVGESFRGIPVGFWLLGSLVLFRKEGRWIWIVIVGWASVLALLSLGPCPVWSRGVGTAATDALWSWPILGDTVWWAVSYLHYYDRLAAGACLMLGLAAAIGVERTWENRTRRSRVPLALVIGYSLIQILGLHHRTLQQPEVWRSSPEEQTAMLLRDLGPGAVVELPYDQRHQFLSVLQSSDHPRVNTIRPQKRPKDPPGSAPESRKIVDWFDQLGRGVLPASSPSRNEISQVGIRWVFFDPSRCDEEGPYVEAAACSSEVLGFIVDAIGEGRSLENGLRIWEIAGGLSPLLTFPENR